VEFDDTVSRLLSEKAALERRLTSLRSAVSVHSLVVITDPSGVILEVNDRFCEVSGYSREELVGHTPDMLDSGYHPPEFFERLVRDLEDGAAWHGEIRNRAKDGGIFWLDTTVYPRLDEDGTPQRFVALCGDQTREHVAEERVFQLAYTDSVTGLPNATSLAKSIADVGQQGCRHLGFLSISIDDYVTVSHAFGVAAGATMLRGVAAVLHELEGPGLILGRLGERSFGLFLANAGEDWDRARRACHELAARVAAMLDTVVDVADGVLVRFATRVGFALWRSDELEPPEHLIGWADIARRNVSEADGARRIGEFCPAMLEEAKERVALAAALRVGLARGELRLHLQPVVDRDRTVVGYEGLVRWESPERGFVSAAEIIPLAEQIGLIVDIGEWAVDEACRLLASWRTVPELSGRDIAVNIGTKHLEHEDFIPMIAAALARHGAPAERLILEITESSLMTDIELAIRRLGELDALGIPSSLDDFGTGYSSLSYLQRLPVYALKIDRSFVQRAGDSPQSRAIVTAVVGVAKALGLRIVAEGVETEEHFAVVHELGVEAFQGWLFGRPAPAETV